MARQGAGVAPLGHPALSKVKLEGPKKFHDYHGSDASVPGKGNAQAIPNKHWEREYDATDGSKNMYATEGSDFNPKCAYERKTTHIKVNECDH